MRLCHNSKKVPLGSFFGGVKPLKTKINVLKAKIESLFFLLNYCDTASMRVAVDFCSQKGLEYNISESDAGLCGKDKFFTGRFGINRYQTSLFIFTFKNHHCQGILNMFLNSSF